MARQLNVRNDEAYHLAHTLAQNENMTAQEIVLRALRDYSRKLDAQHEEMPAEKQAFVRQLTALGKKYRGKWKYGEMSDHSDMYDEYGLPI